MSFYDVFQVNKSKSVVSTSTPSTATNKAEIPLHSLVIKPEKSVRSNPTPINLTTNGQPGAHVQLFSFISF